MLYFTRVAGVLYFTRVAGMLYFTRVARMMHFTMVAGVLYLTRVAGLLYLRRERCGEGDGAAVAYGDGWRRDGDRERRTDGDAMAIF